MAETLFPSLFRSACDLPLKTFRNERVFRGKSQAEVDSGYLKSPPIWFYGSK